MPLPHELRFRLYPNPYSKEGRVVSEDLAEIPAGLFTVFVQTDRERGVQRLVVTK